MKSQSFNEKSEQSFSLNRFLSAGRIHITAIAAAGCLTFGLLFTGKYQWLLVVVCAFDWFIVNLINRTKDLAEDEANQIQATGFVRRNKDLFTRISLITLILSFPLVHLLNPAITLYRMLYHLLGVVYNWPLLFGQRLKNLYFWKNNASATGFMLTLFAYPLATLYWQKGGFVFPEGISWSSVVLSGIFFFLFEISYEVIYDLRDVKGDRLAGVRTYPVVHGERTACHIIDGLLMASMAVLAIGFTFQRLPWRIFIMIFAPGLQFVLYKKMHKRGLTSTDCINLTWLGVIMLVFYNIWLAADLPGSNW